MLGALVFYSFLQLSRKAVDTLLTFLIFPRSGSVLFSMNGTISPLQQSCRVYELGLIGPFRCRQGLSNDLLHSQRLAAAWIQYYIETILASRRWVQNIWLRVPKVADAAWETLHFFYEADFSPVGTSGACGRCNSIPPGRAELKSICFHAQHRKDWRTHHAHHTTAFFLPHPVLMRSADAAKRAFTDVRRRLHSFLHHCKKTCSLTLSPGVIRSLFRFF